MLWLTVIPLTLAVVLAGWALVEPEPPVSPAPAVSGTSVSAEDELCNALAREMRVMGRGVIRELRRHRAAHIKFKKKQIPFGPEDKPGTVLYIWRTTLHKGMLHSHHFEELDDIMRSERCFAPV